MLSKQIRSTNPYEKAVNNKAVETKEYNNLQKDLAAVYTAIESSIIYGDAKVGDVVGGNYTNIDSSGHLEFVGTARPWRDELSDAVSLQETGTGISRNTTEVTVDYTYQSNLSDFMYANVQMNHDKDLTASIYPHIHWVQAKNYSPNFLLQYRWQTNGRDKTTAWTNLPCNALAFTYATGSLNQISYSAAITPPPTVSLSDIVQFKIIRDNANTSGAFTGTDPYNTGGNATVSVLAFDVHMMLNSLGSDDEYVK